MILSKITGHIKIPENTQKGWKKLYLLILQSHCLFKLMVFVVNVHYGYVYTNYIAALPSMAHQCTYLLLIGDKSSRTLQL